MNISISLFNIQFNSRLKHSFFLIHKTLHLHFILFPLRFLFQDIVGINSNKIINNKSSYKDLS